MLVAFLVAAALSAEGYQSTKWGMTVEQVRAQYPTSIDAAEAKKQDPKADVKGDFVFAETTILRRKAYATFTFAKGALVQVVVRPEKENASQCDEIADAFDEKYGASKDRKKSDGADLFELHATWDRTETKIEFDCTSMKTKAGYDALKKKDASTDKPDAFPSDSVRLRYKKK